MTVYVKCYYQRLFYQLLAMSATAQFNFIIWINAVWNCFKRWKVILCLHLPLLQTCMRRVGSERLYGDRVAVDNCDGAWTDTINCIRELTNDHSTWHLDVLRQNHVTKILLQWQQKTMLGNRPKLFKDHKIGFAWSQPLMKLILA